MSRIGTRPGLGRRMSIRWKVAVPFAMITVLVLAVLLPITNRLVARRTETEADRRLSEIAKSVTALIESSEEKARLSANFVANLPEVEMAGSDRGAIGAALAHLKVELGLQELSYYASDFQAGDPALYYGGPPVVRFLQVSEHTTRIRDGLIQRVLDSGQPASGVAIAPQASQIIGVSPVHPIQGPDAPVEGVVLTAFYLDQVFVDDISLVMDADVAVVKDNAIIASTIDRESGYERYLQQGFIDPGGAITARYLETGAGVQQRLLAHPLILGGEPQGALLVAQSIDNLLQVRRDIQVALFVFAGGIGVVSVLLGAGALITFARPLTALAEATNLIRGGALEQRVDAPYFLFRDEITELSDDFNAMTERLQELYRSLEQQVREHERTEHELRVARRIQQLLLPKEVPQVTGWQMAASYLPARAVGGDFYDFLELPDQRLGVIIGDATDKGMPAALVMATTRSTLRATASRLVSPGLSLRRVNDLLCPEFPPNMFVTCLYAVLDPSNGSLRFSNAGHSLPYRRSASEVAELRATGLPLGLMPGMDYEEMEATLDFGESLLLYSDGLIEAHSPDREMFSCPRLEALLREHDGGPALIDYLLSELAAFTGVGWEQEDDVTLVSLLRSGDR